MADQILIVAPSAHFATQARLTMRQHQLDCPIITSDDPNYLTAIDTLLAHTPIRCVITRGYNVHLLRERLTLPIFDVRYTFEDIYQSVEAARQFSSHIAFIATNEAWAEANFYKQVTNTTLVVPKIATIADIPAAISTLAQQGLQVFIGGQVSEHSAHQHGLAAVDIAVTNQSLDATLNEAVAFCQIEQAKDQKHYFIEQLLETADRVNIAVSPQGALLYCNQRGYALLGEQLSAFITTQIVPVIAANAQLLNQVVTIAQHSFILDVTPLNPHFTTSGFLATLEPVADLQTKAGDVRQQLKQHRYTAKSHFRDILGASPTLMRTIDQAKRFAKTESTILLTGETGTGKELFAQSIHNHSPRAAQPFIAVNCAALSASVLESELFGYERGAFTGADHNGKIGLFEAAHHGTIFLDEIGEISPTFQTKLLRILQEKEVTRIGATKAIPLDVRIIAATNQDLAEAVSAGRFRADLYYRLNVLYLNLPPLRERPEDIKTLAVAFFAATHRPLRLANTALTQLASYSFPGNVRQLQNIVERLVVLADGDTIAPAAIHAVLQHEPLLEPSAPPSIDEGERALIIKTLLQFNNNKTLTAKQLHISKTTLWRKLKKYDLN